MDLSRTSHLTYSMSGTLAASCPGPAIAQAQCRMTRIGVASGDAETANPIEVATFFWRWRNAVLISLGMKGKVFVRQAARAAAFILSLPPSLPLSFPRSRSLPLSPLDSLALNPFLYFFLSLFRSSRGAGWRRTSGGSGRRGRGPRRTHSETVSLNTVTYPSYPS